MEDGFSSSVDRARALPFASRICRCGGVVSCSESRVPIPHPVSDRLGKNGGHGVSSGMWTPVSCARNDPVSALIVLPLLRCSSRVLLQRRCCSEGASEGAQRRCQPISRAPSLRRFGWPTAAKVPAEFLRCERAVHRTRSLRQSAIAYTIGKRPCEPSDSLRLAAVLFILLAAGAPAPAPSDTPQELAVPPGGDIPAEFKVADGELRPSPARGRDRDARRREAPHGDPGPEGSAGSGHCRQDADPPHPHALRRRQSNHPRGEPATAGGGLLGRRRRGPRGLHPGLSGRPRQVRLGGRIRDEPAPARAAESDRRRPRDRHLGHHRLAGQELAGDQRQGRHDRHLLPGVPGPDGSLRSPSGIEGRGARQPDGRLLDRRRLVPQRSVPPGDGALCLRADGGEEERLRFLDRPLRRLHPVPRRGVGGRARPRDGHGSVAVLAAPHSAPGLRQLLAGAGGRPAARPPAAHRADPARRRPLGPGGHLRRPRELCRARSQRHGQRSQLPGARSLAPRRLERRRPLPRGDPLRR